MTVTRKHLAHVQAQLHALASHQETYSEDPHPEDCPSEEWAAWLADLDLDRRQGEISELMINNNNIRSAYYLEICLTYDSNFVLIRKNYSSLVPSKVQHKLFWARYFFKVDDSQ